MENSGRTKEEECRIERERERAQYSPALHVCLSKFVGATIVVGR